MEIKNMDKLKHKTSLFLWKTINKYFQMQIVGDELPFVIAPKLGRQHRLDGQSR